MKEKLEKQLHEQYTINNNSKTSSMIAILTAVMIAFTAYGYALYNPCPTSRIDMLLCASNAVIGVIVLLYVIAVYLGTDQRKEQFISFAIRVKYYKDCKSNYNSIYPKTYNPFNKTFCHFVQGL
jgi:Ca2+/H+ antiporter